MGSAGYPGGTVTGGGTLMLGQEQDVLGGGGINSAQSTMLVTLK